MAGAEEGILDFIRAKTLEPMDADGGDDPPAGEAEVDFLAAFFFIGVESGIVLLTGFPVLVNEDSGIGSEIFDPRFLRISTFWYSRYLSGFFARHASVRSVCVFAIIEFGSFL